MDAYRRLTIKYQK